VAGSGIPGKPTWRLLFEITGISRCIKEDHAEEGENVRCYIVGRQVDAKLT
jgi:hypothetical protein